MRAALVFLVLPGTAAFVVPLWMLARGPWVDTSGLVPLALGIVVLDWCVRGSYVAGTLAPWAPPLELVVTGLYRVARNLMYIAVVLVLWAWAPGFRSRSLTIYALTVMLAFHLRVVFFEEPWLARTHGMKGVGYKARVPCWCGFRGWSDGPNA